MARVFIACEFSGVVRDAFRGCGHDAMSCDLIESERPGPHVIGSALPIPGRWDLMIAHPPCTFTANSGIRWLYIGGRKANGRDENRWSAMRQGARFVNDLWNSEVERVCIEQPEIHVHAQAIIGIPVTQSIQPWMFGHWETKETCLRLKNLPPLAPTYRTIDECRKALGLPADAMPKPRVHHASPGPNRWKERSRTPPGIADAMATQWGDC